MTVGSGEIWVADVGDERRQQVYVLSDARFHRLGDRALIAPILDRQPDRPMPWYVPWGSTVIAVNQLGTTTLGRLLERVDNGDLDTLRRVRRVARELIGVGG